METVPKKSQHYVLVMDEKRNMVLALMYGVMSSTVGKLIFEAICTQAGVTKEEYTDFFREWGDKEHELGWCKDKNCTQNKSQNV